MFLQGKHSTSLQAIKMQGRVVFITIRRKMTGKIEIWVLKVRQIYFYDDTPRQVMETNLGPAEDNSRTHTDQHYLE